MFQLSAILDIFQIWLQENGALISSISLVTPNQETPNEILREILSKYDINSTHKTDPFLFYVLRPNLSLSLSFHNEQLLPWQEKNLNGGLSKNCHE
jgi:hypothetical protein